MRGANDNNSLKFRSNKNISNQDYCSIKSVNSIKSTTRKHFDSFKPTRMISYPETITLSEDTTQKNGNINVIQRGKITNTIKDSFPNLQLILDWYGAKVGNTSEKSSNISHYQGNQNLLCLNLYSTDTLGASTRVFLIQNSFNSKHKFRKQVNTSSSIDSKPTVI